jgi:hypothetical protein
VLDIRKRLEDSKRNALIIAGDSLILAEKDEELNRDIFDLTCQMEVVVACRTTPN